MTGACIHQAILCMCVFYCFCFVVYFSVVGLGVGGLLFAHYSMNFQAHFIFMPTVHNSRLCHCQCVSYSVFFSSWFMTLLVQLELAWWLVGLEFDICHRTTMTFAWRLVGLAFDMSPDNHDFCMMTCWLLFRVWRLSPDNHDVCYSTTMMSDTRQPRLLCVQLSGKVTINTDEFCVCSWTARSP